MATRAGAVTCNAEAFFSPVWVGMRCVFFSVRCALRKKKLVHDDFLFFFMYRVFGEARATVATTVTVFMLHVGLSSLCLFKCAA